MKYFINIYFILLKLRGEINDYNEKVAEHVLEPGESSSRVQILTVCYTITLSKINQLASDIAGSCCWSQNFNPSLSIPPFAKKVLSTRNVLDTKHIYYSFFNLQVCMTIYIYMIKMFDNLAKVMQLINNWSGNWN